MFKLAKSHNWLIYKLINPELEKRLRQYASGRMLDIGCGEMPYKEMAAPYVKEHVGLDHEASQHDTGNAALIGTAYEIPAEDSTFDTVLCTDVLEHLEEPSEALAETCRVLKPGAYAIYTVPLFWHIHEAPRDFYRYTRHGLTYLFEKNGFEVIEIKALSGFCATFAQELVYFLYRFRGRRWINPLWWIIPPISFVIQRLAYLINQVDRSEDFSVEYLAVARKKGAGVD